MLRVYAPTMREILSAQRITKQHILRSPLRYSPAFSARYGSNIFMKLENWQPTGSFKVRGAVNFIFQLDGDERGRGLVTASAGNHALAVGYAAQQLHKSGVTVYVPRTAPRAKIEKLKRMPITVYEAGETYDEAHHAAEEFGKSSGATFVHAYDDARTVAGAGTIGLEVMEDQPDLDAILVPVGGGGLISGIAIAVKAVAPQVRVYGVQPEASPALRDSLRDGRAYEQYDAAPTICDGLAGGIGRIVFEVAQKYVDDVIIVGEDAVRRAVAAFVGEEQMVVEGSGAVGVAALENLPASLKDRRIGLVISGANIDSTRLETILGEQPG